eukprot:GHVL01011238.1.p1 GENE.GHVL01011238.1~~GHVL01011238.1.p1  ORF type:complete len:1105 (-),score=220.61 GHVL01011238.1:167-3481(-)
MSLRLFRKSSRISHTRFFSSFEDSFNEKKYGLDEYGEQSEHVGAHISQIKKISNTQFHKNKIANRPWELFENADTSKLLKTKKDSKARYRVHDLQDLPMTTESFSEVVEKNEIEQRQKNRKRRLVKERNVRSLRNNENYEIDTSDGPPITEISRRKADSRQMDEIEAMEFDISASGVATPPGGINQSADHLLIIKEIQDARNTQDLLNVTEKFLTRMSVNAMAWNITCFGRLARGDKLQLLGEFSIFSKLLKRFSESLERCPSEDLVKVLWGLTKLEHSPSWLNKLIRTIDSNVSELSADIACKALYCLSKMMSNEDRNNKKLENSLIDHLRNRSMELSGPTQITALLTSMARLRHSDEDIAKKMAERIVSQIEDFEIDQIAGVAYAYVTFRMKDDILFNTFKKSLLYKIGSCTVKDLVNLTWALSSVKMADNELLKFTVAPAVRALVRDMDAHHISRIMWSFSNAGVQDKEMFDDLCAAMMPLVKDLSPNDIASTVLALAEHKHNELIQAIKRKAVKSIDYFNANQLCQLLYGFSMSGDHDSKLFCALCDKLLEKRNFMYRQNFVQALVALSAANYLDHPIVPVLLQLLAPQILSLCAEDCIEVLKVLSRTPETYRPSQMVYNALMNVHTRIKTWRIGDGVAIADLLEVIYNLRIRDSGILKTVLKQFSSIFDSENCKRSEFIRYIGALACLPREDQIIVRKAVHSKTRMRTLIAESLNQMICTTCDTNTEVTLLYITCRLGLDIPQQLRLAEDIKYRMERQKILLPGTQLCNLIWSLTEINRESQWTKHVCFNFLQSRYNPDSIYGQEGESIAEEPKLENTLDRLGITEEDLENDAEFLGVELEEADEGCIIGGKFVKSGGAADPFGRLLGPNDSKAANHLLKVAWSWIAHGERDYLTDILEDVARGLNYLLPNDLYMAQQVALDLKLQPPPHMSKALSGWLGDILACPRSDLFMHSGQKQKSNNDISINEYNYADVIVKCLKSINVRHNSSLCVENTYRATVTFPEHKHMIDVLNFQDILAPSLVTTASAQMRQRHLTELGWSVHSLHLLDLTKAAQSQTETSLIANIVSTFIPTAKQWVEFKSDESRQESVKNEQKMTNL